VIFSYVDRWSEIERLLTNASHLRLNETQLADVALALRPEAGRGSISFTDDPRHYPHESPPTNDDNTLQFMLLLSAISFCIWQRQGGAEPVVAWSLTVDEQKYVGARGLAAALRRAPRRGQNLYDPSVLQALTLADVSALFEDEVTGLTTLQMLPERLAKLHELGQVLASRYDGHIHTLLQQSGGWLYRQDGRGIIQQLLAHFPVAFGDFPFAKLAQLVVKFIAGRRRSWIPTTLEFDRLTTFHDFNSRLDAAADYYIPFFFLRVGLLEADEQLLEPLRERRLLQPDSPLEQSYRAATLELCRRLAVLTDLSMADLDTLVWKQGYLRCRSCRSGISDEALPCSHRVNCRAFQQEPALMEMCWPLVLTTWY
jgi:hypothetical protein